MKIKKFEEINESSYFHSMRDIDEILDKISKGGSFKSLNASDKAIILNFAKDDEDVRNMIINIRKTLEKILKIRNDITPDMLEDEDKLNLVKKRFDNISNEINKGFKKLETIYKIQSMDDIMDFSDKNKLGLDKHITKRKIKEDDEE